MQKQSRIFLAVYWVLVFVTLLYLTFSLIVQQKTPTTKIQPKAEVSGYTVKEFDGKIAIFENGTSELLRVLEAPFVRDLPSFDRQLLKEGIVVQNENELIKILEDYDY